MLGRVMNCLGPVVIHDGHGHPRDFQTFNGHADLGKNALRMSADVHSAQTSRVRYILISLAFQLANYRSLITTDQRYMRIKS